MSVKNSVATSAQVKSFLAFALNFFTPKLTRPRSALAGFLLPKNHKPSEIIL
jgi:hypothetical protein